MSLVARSRAFDHQEIRMIPQLGKALDFQAQALLLRAERQKLIASNLANADTPGYVARDFNFAQALREATASTAQANTTTGIQRPASGLQPSTVALRYATSAQTNLDGSSVDMDRERASFAENTVKYEATLRFINGQFNSLNEAMKSPHAG
jgi:flagellar basal-body rod protein FlgB